MRRKWIGIILFLGALAAVLAVVPDKTQMQQNREQEQTAAALREQMQRLSEEEITLQWNLCRWYNRNLEAEEPEKYYQTAYDSILNLGEGMMGLLEVPELGLCIPITHGTDGAVGHDPDSPLPIGGRGNHTVLHLEEAYHWTEEMEVWIEIPGQRLCYRVESIQVMQAQWTAECPSPVEMLILIFDRDDTRTLVRCTRADGPLCTYQASSNP